MAPAPDTVISMRHTKLKAEEAALLAGELNKPTWESRNEGIHERVSFEDSIWGFDLAGGAFYNTPLRVTRVKNGSRAQKAGIRPGDRLKRINDIDTSTLTIQEAHEIIIESGIHLKIAVTAPEDEEDAYYCYQDQVEDGYDSEEERRIEEEKARKRQVHAKVSSYWSLKWPWVSKRRVIYRESNCFMVPSKYEEKHRELFPPLPVLRTEDDIVSVSAKKDMENKKQEQIAKDNGASKQNGNVDDNHNRIKELDNHVKTNISSTPNTQYNESLENILEAEEISMQEDDTSSHRDEPSEATSTKSVEEKTIPKLEISTDDETSSRYDDIIDEVLQDDSQEMSSKEQDFLLNGMLSDSEAQMDTFEEGNER